MAKWIKCNGSDFLSATNLKVFPTCFLTVRSCFSRRTDTKVCVSKLTTQFSSNTWFLTETTCKEWELKITKILHFHFLNMLKLFGDSKNHRGGTDAKFIQEEQKQNKTLKLIKINYFQFKKQFIAVIWFQNRVLEEPFFFSWMSPL